MKLYLFVILFFISTAYLFSQTEENEIIKVNTVVRIDTLILIKIDTITVKKIDTVIVNKPIEEVVSKEKGNIFSVRYGLGVFAGAISTTLDIQVNGKFNVSFCYYTGGAVMDPPSNFFYYGLGLGYVPLRTKNFILKFDIRPGSLFSKKFNFGLNLGIDFIYKAISLSPDVFFAQKGRDWGGAILLSLGYNFKY